MPTPQGEARAPMAPSRCCLGGCDAPVPDREVPQLPNFGQSADLQRDRAGQDSPIEPEIVPGTSERLLQRMEEGQLESSGDSAGRVREEKWSNVDLKSLKVPPPQTQAVPRATLVQHFEADFTHHLGIISPAATFYAEAVIAVVKRDLPPVYRTRRFETTESIGLLQQSKKSGMDGPKALLMCSSRPWVFYRSSTSATT